MTDYFCLVRIYIICIEYCYTNHNPYIYVYRCVSQQRTWFVSNKMRKENVHCVVLTLSFLVLFDVTANAEMLFFHWLLPIKTIPSHTFWHGNTSLRKKTRITKDSRGVKSVRLCYFLIWKIKNGLLKAHPILDQICRSHS